MTDLLPLDPERDVEAVLRLRVYRPEDFSVVPELQRRGLASAAVALLCKSALSRGAKAVVADTLPELVPSQRVLA